MTDESNSLTVPETALSRAKGFGMLWVKLICLGGFIVLIGGPRVIGILQGIFGPAAAQPGRVITINMLLTLPIAAFFWFQQSRRP
jgi:hypothetical protein